MEKDKLFNKIDIEKIVKLRKLFLKLAVWILIAELVLGAILILSQSWDLLVSRIQGTFLIIALVLFVSVNNFIRIEKGNKVIQGFALAGFVADMIWAAIAFLLMWEIVPFSWTEEVMKSSYYGGSYHTIVYHMTPWSIVMAVFAYAAAACFWISNVMSIKETIKLVKPLKIAAVVCVCYCWAFGTVMTFIEPEFEDVDRFYYLAGLAGLAFIITSLAAVIISKTNKKKTAEAEVSTGSAPKSDAELRAEIEEQVRREMIEKEVRAKMEAEQKSMDSSDKMADEGSKVEDSEKIVEESFEVKD